MVIYPTLRELIVFLITMIFYTYLDTLTAVITDVFTTFPVIQKWCETLYTVITIGFTSPDYTVSEDVGSVTVCLRRGRVRAEDFDVVFTTMDNLEAVGVL